MNGVQLQKTVVQTFRGFSPGQPELQAFFVAVAYRRRHVGTFESDFGQAGLGAALERAFLLYDPAESLDVLPIFVDTKEMSPEDLANTAAHISVCVYDRFRYAPAPPAP